MALDVVARLCTNVGNNTDGGINIAIEGPAAQNVGNCASAACINIFGIQLLGTPGAGLEPPPTPSPPPQPRPPVDSETVIGNPDKAAPFWQWQAAGSCLLCALAGQVGQVTGTMPTEAQIAKAASTMGSVSVAKPDQTVAQPPQLSTSLDDYAVFFARYGIQATVTEPPDADQALADLETALKDGKAVSVSLRGNHVVQVTGVDRDNATVYINDSARLDGSKLPMSLADFEAQWAEGAHTMIVTNQTVQWALPWSAIGGAPS